MTLRLHKLSLSAFRSYPAARLETGGAGVIVLTGDNGAGKTNILEAVSLLVPGKGLRGGEWSDIKNKHTPAEEPWAVAAEAESKDGLRLRIGTGMDAVTKKRSVRIEGRAAKSQHELAEHLAAVWLTPQMDRLFLDGPRERRKFLDRLVFALDTAHAGRVHRYEKTLRERLKILTHHERPDARWLDTLEQTLAQDAVSIAAARADLLARLQGFCAALALRQPLFPSPRLGIEGWVENAILNNSALALEDAIRDKLRHARDDDRLHGRTREGVHRSDFLVTHDLKAMPAAQCSTGEQKALLVALVLAHAMMVNAEKGFTPLILLDEVAAHFDVARKDALFDILKSLGGQVWLTGTAPDIFTPLRGDALFLRVATGQIHSTHEKAA